MTSSTGSRIEVARRKAALEVVRADRVGEMAARHERLAQEGPSALAEFHHHIAHTHRGTEASHLVAARIHRRYAEDLQAWADVASGPQVRPSFIHAVAAVAGTPSAAMALYGSDRSEVMVTASDTTAQLAQDVEFTLGEGPAKDAVAGQRPVVAAGGEVTRRWPQYGRALAALGVTAVTAVPLADHRSTVGTLALFSPPSEDQPGPATRLSTILTIADALTDTVLRDLRDVGAAEVFIRSPLLGGTDDRRVVHLAAGIVSEQLACDLAAAMSLIRARAFADEVPSVTVANAIVSGELRLAES